MVKNGLFIFHRDLRIIDNIGLIQASKACDHLYCCFIFTPDQVGKSNAYRSQNAIDFMIESLEELSGDLGNKLLVFYGSQMSVLSKIVPDLQIDGIYFNRDYSPYAVARDEETVEFCHKKSIACEMFADYYLFEPGTVHTGSGGYYKKFTPFYDAVVHRKVDKPIRRKLTNIAANSNRSLTELSLDTMRKRFTKTNPNVLVHGGRTNGLNLLKQAIQKQSHYDDQRDHFIYSTSFLSAAIKFGCVSIREVYHGFLEKKMHGIIRELIWREFFAHVLYAYPEVLIGSYQPKYKHLNWRTSAVDLDKWKRGDTGFPIVDACMRQMNATGYMHNRGRMVVASFLIKVLLLDWRLGEQYFAQCLTDYDPASNNGNWQGISGTGVDMKPYFRDMNPWIQSAKYDKDAEFIRKWVPELESVSAKDIHRWNVVYLEQQKKDIHYPGPMVDYAEQKEKMLVLYSK